ncbi:MAG TPA: hypothetical protein VGB61_05350 [Pyrinomonadaceae bacterium]|jgi:hypothetical protein
MTRDIEDRITECLSRTPASVGDNLLGFQLDLEMSLISDKDLFVEPRVRQTGDSRCALIGTCKLADSATAPEVVIKRLKELWLGHLTYEHLEAHSIEALPGRISLRFVTTSGETSDDLCVTGEIIVSR